MDVKQIVSTLFLSITSFVVLADRYGMHEPEKEYTSSAFPIAIYTVIMIWATLSKEGPLKPFANQNPGLASLLFLFIGPVLVAMLSS